MISSSDDLRRVQRPLTSLWGMCMEPMTRWTGIAVLGFPFWTPLRLTLAGFLCGLLAAAAFLTGGAAAAVLGFLLYQVANLFDSLDGLVARARPGSGSPFALMLDHCLDPWRLTLAVAAVAGAAATRLDNPAIIGVAGLFLAIHFADWCLPVVTQHLRQRYRTQSAPKLNGLDRRLLAMRDRLAIHRLRLIMFSHHEREILVLGIGPILGLEFGAFAAATILTALFLSLRLRFDLALLRSEIVTGHKEYLGDVSHPWEAGNKLS